MIQLRAEWQPAPGVRDRVLAQTWARLQIEVDGSVVTRLIDSRSDRIRRGVYYSVLPLAQWIVQNWWFLLNEPYRFPGIEDSRTLAQNIADRRWVQRHSLLAAREGGALPDLTLFRDGDRVVARWFADGGNETSIPVQFVGSGEKKIVLAKVEEGLAQFVETVITRLRGLDEPEVKDLREDWAETREDSIQNRHVCEWSAQLGLDPNDPAELSGEILATLEGAVAPLEEAVREDFLDAEEPRFLTSDLRWLGEVRRAAADAGRPSGDGTPTHEAGDGHAHKAGYRGASDLRKFLIGADRGGPIPNLNETLLSLGWARDPCRDVQSLPAGALSAAVEHSEEGGAVAVMLPGIRPEQKRFRTARAIWFRHFGGNLTTRRLVTGAHTWDQRGSRAFAAQFLAPAEGLRQHVGGRVSRTEVEQLADQYEVSSSVIRHQIENHRIGWVESG